MFKGTLSALVTPFNHDGSQVDYSALGNLIEWQASLGVDGFVVGGTTGESACLSFDERMAALKFVIECVKGKYPVIAGTGTNSTQTTISYTKAAKELNVDGVLISSPYYNKPTQEGLYAHYATIAKECDIPIVVYNIPGRTAVDINVSTFEKLVAIPQIKAVKEASGSAAKLMELSASVADKVALLSGEDNLTYLFMACGGKGVISASANVIPKEMSTIVNAWNNGQHEEALAAQCQALPIINALFLETNPAPAKAALKILGKIKFDTLRLPLVSVREETRQTIQHALKQGGY